MLSPRLLNLFNFNLVLNLFEHYLLPKIKSIEDCNTCMCNCDMKCVHVCTLPALQSAVLTCCSRCLIFIFAKKQLNYANLSTLFCLSVGIGNKGPIIHIACIKSSRILLCIPIHNLIQKNTASAALPLHSTERFFMCH